MDKGAEDTIENYYYYVEPEEIDEDYEFDAARFFDFTRPELDFEIEEAESWFRNSGDYNPSPFVVKLNLEKLLVPNNALNGKGIRPTSKKNQGKVTQMLPDSETSKTKFGYRPRSSTLMKPTLSHLAKQNKLQDIQSYCCSSSHRSSNNLSEKSSHSGIGLDILSTKRQKLEIGYLRKMAHLKHHTSFLHKSSKKVTIPREPELETMLRAQRRSSKNVPASNENDKEMRREHNFKALPLNKKAPFLMQPRKSTQQLTQIQMFHLMTTERANQHAIAKASKAKSVDRCVSSGSMEARRVDARETMKPRKPQLDSKTCVLTEKVNDNESESTYGDMNLEAPPVEQFNQLSLRRDAEDNDVAPSATTDILQKKSHTKTKQCGDHIRVHESESWANINIFEQFQRLGHSLKLLRTNNEPIEIMSCRSA